MSKTISAECYRFMEAIDAVPLGGLEVSSGCGLPDWIGPALRKCLAMKLVSLRWTGWVYDGSGRARHGASTRIFAELTETGKAELKKWQESRIKKADALDKIPILPKSDGERRKNGWIPAREAAKFCGVKLDYLRQERSAGLKGGTPRRGKDKRGRIWAAEGETSKIVWYKEASLKRRRKPKNK